MAWQMGSPERASQTTVVSRWLVMPMPATCSPESPAMATASVITAASVAQISRASCSTQPGIAKYRALLDIPKARLRREL